MKYIEDSYLKEFETKVKEITKEKKIILEDTIFYPESGGQASDHGEIIKEKESFKVLNVKKEQGKIVHEVDKEGLKTGDEILCKIDWERRYKLMRSHSATHIICGILNKKENVLITGNNITPEKIRIDFSLENFDRERLEESINEANEVVKQDIPIESYNLTRAEVEANPGMVKLAKGLPPSIKTLRILKIGDVDEQPDGGTHVKSTKEVGKMELIKCENRGKNNRRLYIQLEDDK